MIIIKTIHHKLKQPLKSLQMQMYMSLNLVKNLNVLFTKTFSPESLSTAVHKKPSILDHHCVCIASVRFVTLMCMKMSSFLNMEFSRLMFFQRQEGSETLCSSILLACERMMRLKKSSSGTVGPREEGGGGAHL